MFEILTLTPAMAKEWLENQAPNRNKKPTKIVKFARDMKHGRWEFTGETIKFDRNGQMIDGQNRCYAVIEANTPITAAIVRGLDPAAQSVMDCGSPRSTRDALTFAGYANAKDLSATISTHFAWKVGAFSSCVGIMSGTFRLTNAEMLDYATEHPELAAYAERAKHLYNQGLKLPCGAIATAVAETTAIDPDASIEFFDRIVSLKTAGAGDPIYTLLKRVTAMQSGGPGRVYPSTALFVLFRTWNAVRAGETLKKFQFGAAATEQHPATWAKIPEPR